MQLMSTGDVGDALQLGRTRVHALVAEGVLSPVARTKAGLMFDMRHVRRVAEARAIASRGDWRVREPDLKTLTMQSTD